MNAAVPAHLAGPGLAAPAAEAAVLAQGLGKRYGDRDAVTGLDLDVAAGAFFGLLGPNGSGKTSTLHMLSTLIRPSAGSARVAGVDVASDPVEVRRRIGIVFQESALDRNLGAAENLVFAGRLHGLSRDEARRRARELLELFGLADRALSPVASLSGGMRRALDIARGVIHRPRVLFLDEPTIGLDLPSRRRIWHFIGRLRAEQGVTVFLTTHYLEEASDCDQVAFIRAGRLVAQGRPAELVAGLGAYVVEVRCADPRALAERLAGRLGPAVAESDRALFRHADDDPAPLLDLHRELAGSVESVAWRRPNLNDVFLWVNAPGGGRP